MSYPETAYPSASASATVTAAKKMSHTTRSIDRLRNARQQLEETLDILGDKVREVILPPGPVAPGENTTEPMPACSMIAMAIDTEACLLEQVNHQLRELIDRLDL